MLKSSSPESIRSGRNVHEMKHARKRESQCVVYVYYLAFFCRFWLELFVGFLHTDKYCCSPDYTSFVLLSESWFLILRCFGQCCWWAYPFDSGLSGDMTSHYREQHGRLFLATGCGCQLSREVTFDDWGTPGHVVGVPAPYQTTTSWWLVASARTSG